MSLTGCSVTLNTLSAAKVLLARQRATVQINPTS